MTDLHTELCDLERRVGALRERVRLAGLLTLDDVLEVAHRGLQDCVVHVAPSDEPRRAP